MDLNAPMLETILPYMRCPRCTKPDLRNEGSGLACRACHAVYPIRTGILNMVESEADEVITPFQRVMQMPLVVSIYEKMWRRIGYYLASSRSFSKEMQTVLRLARISGNGRSLDLACGPGVFTRPLARRSGGAVIGLDLSWPMLRHAQKALTKERVQNILLIRATAFSLPFVDNAFQYINCCGALHLFDKPASALKEMARVLDDKGHLCVQTTIRPARSAGIAFILEKIIRFGFFDEEELGDLLRRHGFEISESERHRISFTFLATCSK
jgi:ubiquinone/menaquinone biosynthesis C-methylase UbiE